MRRDALVRADRAASLGLPQREDLVVSRAKGTNVWDISGRRFTDLFSGISVANVGHSHPAVVRAIAVQAKRYMHVSGSYVNDVSPVLAQELGRISPGRLRRCFFANSGAEAVEGAVKFAKKRAAARGNPGMVLVAYQGSFHGRLALSLTLTGQHKYKRTLGNFAAFPGVVHLRPPYHFRYGDGLDEHEFGRRCADELIETLDSYLPGDVAALIIEPIFGEGGIIVPPANYLPSVQQICRQRGIAFIVDEVQTGIGRTGRMFASEHWRLSPDIITLAKGLGGGLPLAAVLATEDVASALEPGDHFSTFGGNPVCCAAGLAALRALKSERLVENSSRRGAQMKKLLNEENSRLPLVGEIRGKGLMVGVELVRDRKGTPAQKEALAVKSQMFRLGYLLGVGGIHRNVLRIQPPLMITEDEVDAAASAISESLRMVSRGKLT